MVQVRQLEGRDHFVVPMVMLTVGVHSGSRGSVLYDAETLRLSAPYWSGRPVVVYHPALGTNPLHVHDRQKIGSIFNSTFDGHRLKAEAWIEIERARQVDIRILDAIRARRPLEVSTGMSLHGSFLIPGVHNGKLYDEIARGIIPDHLAILPDQLGACGIADGCGLLTVA